MEASKPTQAGTVDDPKAGTCRTVLVCVALAAVTLAAFAPMAGNGFVSYDDPDYVTRNPHVLGGLSWPSVVWAFQSGYAGNWHPVTWLSHMLDVQLWGLKPAGHHLTSLLLHAANAVLLFLVLRRAAGGFNVEHPTSNIQHPAANLEPRTSNLEPRTSLALDPRRSTLDAHPSTLDPCWACALVAALFALHPLHVESVAWIAERKDVLSGLFFLLTLWAYVRYAEGRRQKAEGRRKNAECRTPFAQPTSSFCIHPSAFYFFALVCFALGLMSKPMLVTLPFVLLLLDYWPLGRMQKEEGRMQNGEADHATRNTQHATLHRSTTPPLRLVLEKLPFFALAAASCAVTFVVQRGAGAVNSLETLPLEFRISNALISYVRYVGKLVWPAELAVFYPAPTEWPAGYVAVAALVLAGVTALALRCARRAPWFAFGWFWYLGTLVPVIGLVQVGMQSMADRYSYLPLIGLFVAAVWAGADAAGRWPRSRGWLAAGAGAALVACGALTWRQTGHWRDSASLFTHALAVTRDNFVAHNNLGVMLLDKDQTAAAEEHFAEAVRIKRNYPEALGNLALCRVKQGRMAEATELLERSLQGRATADVWYNRGLLEEKQGRLAEAQHYYEEALRLRPEHAQSHLTLGILLAAQNRGQEALAHFQAAVRGAPDNADAHFNLALALNNKGDYAGAAAQYAEVCRLQPDDLEARRNLGTTLLVAGKTAEAAAQLQEVLRTKPDAPTHHRLALALDSQGQVGEAAGHYREAVRLSPDTPLYLNDLAWFLATNPKAELRDGAEAVRLAERARDLSGGKQALCWGTLDAAYAEAGRFTDALAAAAKARDLAQAAGQTDIAHQAEERMALYREGKQYRRQL